MKNFHDYLEIIQEKTANIPSRGSEDHLKMIAQKIYNMVKSDGMATWNSTSRSEVYDNKKYYGVQKLSEDQIIEVLGMVDKMF
jgi:hypothetical protein